MSKISNPVWEERYKKDILYRNKYPWSEIVTFIFSNFKTLEDRKGKKVLELGCGTGSNLIFCAKEGMETYGIDFSSTIISYAKSFSESERVNCNFKIGDFTSLPYEDSKFDVIIDRSALCLSTIEGFKKAIKEAQRVLKPGGLFFLSPFGDQDSSFHKVPNKDGTIDGITSGHISGLGGQVLFLSYRDLIIIFNETNEWTISSMKQIMSTDFNKIDRIQQVTWNVILKKNQ